jgi:Rieske Fe-S protein
MIENSAYEKLVGTTLGSYRLERLRERHPWGPIFQATSEGKSFIVRFIDTPLASTAPEGRIVYLGRFLQEANRVSSLQHPHILPLLDYGNYQGTPYLVYPHRSLVSLRSWLTKERQTDAVAVGAMLHQMASALEYAHERAVLHRNFSTGTIFLEDKQIIIAEMGLMHMRELVLQDGTSQARPYEGSSESSAPEQLTGKAADVYTDIYGLGAVLYRLLTGQPPFSAKTRDEIGRQHLYAEVPSLHKWRPDLPSELDAVIARAMAKEPRQRYHRPSELTHAYYEIVAPGQVPAPLPGVIFVAPGAAKATSLKKEAKVSSRPIAAQRANSQVSRRRLVTFLAAGVGVGVVAVAGVFAAQMFGLAAPAPTASSTPAATATAGVQQTSTEVPTPTAAPTQATSTPTPAAAVLARTSEVPVNSAKTFPLKGQQNPGLLIHLPDEKFVAYDSTCTHAGCAVAYNDQTHLLKCPCHDAIFDPAKKGVPVEGPAQSPLAPVKITVNADGTITAG